MQSTSPQPLALSVSELNREAKHLLETHFDWVWVEGEIGNFTAASSGHWYFTLKDEDAQVRCAMFRRANSRIKYRPAQGESVRIRARVSLYEGRGEFQLICEHMEPAGAGALQLAFEQLKSRLAQEGLFAAETKQAIPSAAQHIGVVTSATGAALQDMLTVLNRRSPHSKIYVFPVAVQGDGAALQIAEAIHLADRLHREQVLPLDVLVVGRGGGSLEDLWAFNEEIVARALFAATIPTVSAVGHETDFSIADLAADARAATPSAAAELISADQAELLQLVDGMSGRMTRSLNRLLAEHNTRHSALRKRLRDPGFAMKQQALNLQRLRASLQQNVRQHLATARSDSRQIHLRLLAQHPRHTLARHRSQLTPLYRQLALHMQHRLKDAKAEAMHKQALLRSLGPEHILGRGYAIVTDSSGKVVRQAQDTAAGDAVKVRLQRGTLTAQVTGQSSD
jgi:exodeoxyribonuclease VII large subunit